ncbi:MAG TPA: hypothetical protein VF453_03005 [Burkholderiaceae bacterium]
MDVCTACCCPVEVERELREWPLARLTARHFYQYNDSAKSEVQPAAELRHLLPRLLELIASGEDIHHSTELYLDRLGRCPEGTWSADERAALDRFASAFFDALLRVGTPGRGLRVWMDTPLSVLLMFDIGGIDIGPLLDLWLRCDDPGSTVQFVESTYWDFWQGCEIRNPFAADRPAFRARVRGWLLEPANRARFVEKMLAPAFLERAREQPARGRIAFATMVEAVFDQLTA